MLDDGVHEAAFVSHPPWRPCAGSVQVLDLLRRGEAGAEAAVWPGIEPLAIGINLSHGPRQENRRRREYDGQRQCSARDLLKMT
jgi:hypothetical protein